MDTGATSRKSKPFREVRMLSVDQFYKTKICPHMNKPEGCMRKMKDHCPYAHCLEELRQPPDLYKTAMCKKYLNNCCNKSVSECKYAHRISELRHTEGVYKTYVCKYWLKGHCKVGGYCRFAHGLEEIRINPEVAKNGEETIPYMSKLGSIPQKQRVTLQAKQMPNEGVSETEVSKIVCIPNICEDDSLDNTVRDICVQMDPHEAYCLTYYHLQRVIDKCTNPNAIFQLSKATRTQGLKTRTN